MENQLKMATRKSPSTLFEVRKLIVRLRKKGMGPMAIKEQTGVSWGAIRKAIDLFEAVLVRERFGIKMPVRTVGEYLKRWGFTPQKPEVVKRWLSEEYPAIAARAKAEGAEIHWADETAVMNNDVRGRSYSPRGVAPTTRSVWGARRRVSMISSVNNRGKCYWMIVDSAFNADRLTEFMESLAKGRTARCSSSWTTSRCTTAGR